MKRVAVVFVVTSSNKTALATIAAAVESTPSLADVQLVLHDIRRQGLEWSHLLTLPGTIIVAFSFTTLALLETVKMVTSLRRAARCAGRHDIILVAGGPHASGASEETLLCGFDYIFRGEGEESFALFVNIMRGDNGVDFGHVPGLVFRDDKGHLRKNKRRSMVDLSRYHAIPRRIRLHSYLEITRGCPVACRFCQTSYLLGVRSRNRPLARLVEDVAEISRTGCFDIRLLSPNAAAYGSVDGMTPNIAALRGLLQSIVSVHVKIRITFGTFPSEIWPCSVTDELLDLIAEFASNRLLVVGAQSGSQRMLDMMHRSHGVSDTRNAVDLMLRHGFNTCVDFMFGFPGETIEDEKLTIRFMEELANMGAQIHSHTFMPLAGTPMSASPPAILSERIISSLDRLAGHERQFGRWRTQLNLTRTIHKFRLIVRQTKNVEAALNACEV